MGFLRMFLAITVVFAHLVIGNWQIGIGAIWAVKIFFTISGFYMALVLGGPYQTASNSLFYINRGLKIFPLYWVILLLTLLTAMLSPQHKVGSFINLGLWQSINGQEGHFFLKAYLYLSQLLCFGINWSIFACIDLSTGELVSLQNALLGDIMINSFMLVPQAWSISLELVFYLLAPLLVKLSTKNIIILCTSIFLIKLYLYSNWNLDVNPWNRSFGPLELFYFLMGILSYRLLVLNERLLREGFKIQAAIAFLFLTITCFFIQIFNPNSNLVFSIYFIAFVFVMPVIFNLTKNNKLDAWVGHLSYTIYISHILISGILDQFLGVRIYNMIGAVGWRFLHLISILIFSIIINRWIQIPIDRYRHQLKKYLSLNMQ